MKTLTEKYNAIAEGKYSKSQFIRDARLLHPNLITQFNGYEDTVSILKNKSIIFEQTTEQNFDEADSFSPSTVDKAIRYELDAANVDYIMGSPTEEQFLKARVKAVANLKKDRLYYIETLKTPKKRTDQMQAVTASNVVDKANEMKKVKALKEDHSSNPKDKYKVKKCPTEGNWKVWEGDHLVKKFKTKPEAEKFANKKNKEQGLSEVKSRTALKEAIKELIKSILTQ